MTDEKEKSLTTANQDLGLGERVVEENRTRFLNRDGSFNVHRKGVFERGAFSPYHAFLNMSWPRFYAYVISGYIFVNAFFTALYLLCGSSAFTTIQNVGYPGRIGEVFYFSVHVITTIGESGLTPASIGAKIILSLEAMTGLLGFALTGGLIFARFSNPAVKILFSDRAVIAPYKDITGFMVRIANGRSNELIDVRAAVTLSKLDKQGKRKFYQLELERDSILVFPLSWTIVHPITKESPLFGISKEEFRQQNPEFVIAISAVDEDLSKTVYTRHSYIADEVVIGRKFRTILDHMDDGTVIIDPKRIHEIEEEDPSAPMLENK